VVDVATKNEVTLTFAGDSDKLERAFDRVAESAERMDGRVRDSAASFDRVAESADTVDTRAMGFRDTLTGLQDGFAGIKAVTEDGLGLESLLLLGTGVGDLASGMSNFLAPALKSAVGGMKALNLAFLTSPITIIIAAVAALTAGFVIAYQKSETFRRIVNGALHGVKDVALAVARWFRGPFVEFFQRAWSTITGLPGKLKGAFAKVQGWVTAPFRNAFNAIRNLWNSTLGGKGFGPVRLPGLPDIPGFRIPKLHTGGVVPGARGQEVLTLLQAGERVVPAGAGTGQPVVVELRITGSGPAYWWIHEGVRHGKIKLTAGNARVVVA
jgi:hypothetical protein